MRSCPKPRRSFNRCRPSEFSSPNSEPHGSLIGQNPLQLRSVVRRTLPRPAHLALGLGGLARQDVTLERTGSDDLARACLLEALGGAAVCFQFRHLGLSGGSKPRLYTVAR